MASEALSTDKVVARYRTEAAAAAMSGFANARAVHGAKCYRVIDARAPKGISTGESGVITLTVLTIVAGWLAWRWFFRDYLAGVRFAT